MMCELPNNTAQIRFSQTYLSESGLLCHFSPRGPLPVSALLRISSLSQPGWHSHKNVATAEGNESENSCVVMLGKFPAPGLPIHGCCVCDGVGFVY